MPINWPIALGAGFVAAVVFVSANTGPLAMRYLLFALAPLSIALAGLGWNWRTALVAGVTGTTAIAVISNHATLTAMFAATQAAPMVVLVYLAGLSRPVAKVAPAAPSNGSAPGVEWYPVGRLVVWAAGASSLTALLLLFFLGATSETFAQDLQAKFAQAIKDGMLPISSKSPLGDKDVATLAKFALAMLPAGAAISAMASLLFSMWISGRVTLASGQLERPWPDLAAITFPAGTALVLVIAMAASSFLSGPLGMGATALLGALLFAYLLLGLAVIHYMTRGNPWRSFALWVLYLGVLFAYGVVLVVMMLGISETFLQLRQRFGAPPD